MPNRTSGEPWLDALSHPIRGAVQRVAGVVRGADGRVSGALGSKRDAALNLYEAAEPVFSLTIAEKETDAFVGACGLNPIAEEPAAREIFYDVIVGQQGKGYAREASEALVDHAMKEAGIPKLVAFLRPENTRAVAVAEYLGFEDHGPAMKHGRPGRRYVLSGTRLA